MKKNIGALIISIILDFSLCYCNINCNNESELFQKRTYLVTKTAYAKSSINVSKFRKNSILHTKFGTIVAYYDKDNNPVIELISEEFSEKHSILLKPNISNQLMGDGHAVISLAVYNDKVFFCYGCHSTKGFYGNFSMEKFFDGTSYVNAEKTPIDLTYPQFYVIDDKLFFVYRFGDFIYKDDISLDFNFTKTLLLHCEQGNTVYINELSYENNLLAIPYVVRLPVLDDGYIRNDGIYLFLSNKKNENIIFGGKSSYNKGLPVYPAKKILDIDNYNVLMNQESTYIYDGYIYYTFMCRDEKQIPQVFIGITKLNGDSVSTETYKISKNTIPFLLKGHGTLSLPLSRGQVLVSKDYVHIIYRENENVIISSCKKIELNKGKFIRTLVCNGIKHWEPSVDIDYFRKNQKILLLVQNSEQEDYDKVSESQELDSGVPIMLYEFSELDL